MSCCCSMSLWTCVVIGLGTLIYYYFKKKFSYWRNQGILTPDPRIPLGNIPRGEKHLKDILGHAYDIQNEKPFIGLYFFTRPIVVPTNLDFIQDILVRDFHNFRDRGVYTNETDEPLTGNLFAVDGAQWKSLRSKLTPTFTSGKMKFMFPTIIEVSERFCEALDELLKTESIHDVKELSSQFTTDVIGTCAFGLECNSLRHPNNEFREYGRKSLIPRVGIFGRAIMIQYPNFAKLLRMKMFSDDVSEFFLRVVRETVEYRQQNNVKLNDFMNLLIELMHNETIDSNGAKMEELTLNQISAQAFLFFVAGFETSSTTMMFSLYELALNPDIQEKARTEIRNILDKFGGQLTYDAVKEMVYVDQVISETLRKYSPLPFLARITHDDYQVRNTNITIEKKTRVMIPVYSIHHDAKYYPDPERYDPERFTSEEIKKRHPMAFLGFGDGPRNCIGLRFGRMQSRIGLIKLIQNYRFDICSKTPIPMEFALRNPILTPINGMHLKIEKIQ